MRRCAEREFPSPSGNESIRDDDMVELHEGHHFFARPSASRRTLDDVQEEVTR